MQKVAITIVSAAVLLTGSFASAQSYYPTSSGCTVISRNLTVGARGTDVSALQNFIVSQNYPGGGSWMVTGYFGQATAAGVRNFQSQQGLAMTGIADGATRAAIAANCGTTSYNPYVSSQTPTYPYTSNYSYGYASNYLYNYGTPHIATLSTTSAVPGSPVTVTGTGFDLSNNTVYLGGTTLSGISSVNGTSLSFTVPSNMNGVVSVSVSNTRGVSNAVTLAVAYAPVCNTYPYNTSGTCGCGLVSCANMPLSLTYISPNNGAVGSSVTLYGTGFSRSDNSVHIGNGLVTNLNSSDGTSLTFIVPAQISGYGYQPIGLGSYDISVTNASGVTSNALPYTITSLGPVNTPSITSISGPTTLQTGVSGTWTVLANPLNNTYTSMNVRWGDENLYGSSYPNTQALINSATAQTYTFSHTYAQAGTYTITFTVTNNSGQQNTSTATVVVTTNATPGSPTISYLTPQAGRVGTQVMIVGNGFSLFDNAVHFGVGGTQHLVSGNGTTIYFTIPAYISLCDITPGSNCFATQPVVPGNYQIYVTNANGTTNSITFTVTS